LRCCCSSLFNKTVETLSLHRVRWPSNNHILHITVETGDDDPKRPQETRTTRSHEAIRDNKPTHPCNSTLTCLLQYCIDILVLLIAWIEFFVTDRWRLLAVSSRGFSISRFSVGSPFPLIIMCRYDVTDGVTEICWTFGSSRCSSKVTGIIGVSVRVGVGMSVRVDVLLLRKALST